MSRITGVAAIQMKCGRDVLENIKTADRLVRDAVKKGADIILLPELFERQYFCQERRYEYYEYAKSVDEDAAVVHFTEVARELGVVIIVSFYEKYVNQLYNTVAVIDADGTRLGIYRKTHIPDDHYYQEKFYFVPGNTGFKVFNTRFGCIGVGICRDMQHAILFLLLQLTGLVLRLLSHVKRTVDNQVHLNSMVLPLSLTTQVI